MGNYADIAVIGGGVMGLSAAFELAGRGCSVEVFDRAAPGQSASWAGAGIIPPEAERPGSHPLIALRNLSVRLHPDWAESLRERTGIDTGYRRCGGLDVAFEGEEDALRTCAEAWSQHGVPFEWLSGPAVRAADPVLSPHVTAAIAAPGRSQLRNPRHLKALSAACRAMGVRTREGVAHEGWVVEGGRVRALRTADGEIPCGGCIVTAGPWTEALLAPLGVRVCTPPVRGQIALLRTEPGTLSRIVEHGPYYLVPRDDGRILVGSTEEDAGFDCRTTAAAVAMLIDVAVRLCPALAGAEVERAWAGLRPGSSDGVPTIGRHPEIENLWVAAGHFRAGIQLSPGTAMLMADLVTDTPPCIDPAPFRPSRPHTPADTLFRT